MSIIIRTRSGQNSHTEYDIDDKQGVTALKNNIRAIRTKLKKPGKKGLNYELARLKFIWIELVNASNKGQKQNEDIISLLNILREIDGLTVSEEELLCDPDTLFDKPARTSPKRRTIVDYSANETGSLAAPTNPLVSDLSNPAFILNQVRQRSIDIEEHATSRVELFFLLCVAIYDKQRVITLSETVTQQGKARPGSGNAACHSSLYTAIMDKPHDIELRSRQNTSILNGTFFVDKTLNKTVELPKCVNDFDRTIEGQISENARGLRRKLLPTLNRVSAGELTPHEAMKIFFTAMHNFFDNKAAKYIRTPTKSAPEGTKEMIANAQAAGTFSWELGSSGLPTVKAMSCWLRVSRHVAAIFTHDTSKHKYIKPGIAEKIGLLQSKLTPRYRVIQDEILSTTLS